MSPHRILCDHHQFQLYPGGDGPVLDPSRPSGLAQISDDGTGLIVLTGIARGPVTLDVVLAKAGEGVDGAEWEERQSLVMAIADSLIVNVPTVMDPGVSGPVFRPPVPGPYLVTVLARGRDLAYDTPMMHTDDPIEAYRIVFSPVS